MASKMGADLNSASWTLEGTRFKFSVPEYGPGEAADEARPSTRARLQLLHELVDNGQAEVRGAFVLLPVSEAYGLSDDLQATLVLPDWYPFSIAISATGTFNEPDFGYSLCFCVHHHQHPLKADRSGPLVEIEQRHRYLLSENQYRLCEAVDEANTASANEKTFAHHLRRFAAIKKLALDAGARLDTYLQGEDVVEPGNISLTLTREGTDEIGIAPLMAEEDAKQFLQRFDRFPQVQETYTLQGGDGQRRRIVLTAEQQAGLRTVKQHRKVKGATKEAILATPAEFFDPDVFDLEKFSERVYDIGFYQPRYYPFVSPYRSEWVSGVVVERSPTERAQVTVESEAEAEELDSLLKEALRGGESKVLWKKVELPITEAANLVDRARSAIKKPRHDPQPGVPAEPAPHAGKVLLIKENIEKLEYTALTALCGDEGQLLHRYCAPPRLSGATQLLPHQIEGIAWLQSAYLAGLPGVLLADDMGLGKTLQVLSFVDWLRSTGKVEGRPWLVVAPPILLENWQSEYERFFLEERLPVRHIHGDGTASKPLGNSLCLTTYQTLQRRQRMLCQEDWAVVILDGAQAVKTPGTLTTNAAKALKAHFTVAMTGTPVENTYVDLWCILDSCVPGLLGGAREFAQEYQAPLRNRETNVVELGERLRRRVGIYMKRRVKDNELKDLPPKTYVDLPRDMPPVQRQRYMLEMEQLGKEGEHEEGQKGKILRILHALREISDHPFLLDMDLLSYPLEELIESSAKLSSTVEVLGVIEKRAEKVLVFADRRKTQHLLARVIEERFGLEHVAIINGETPTASTGSGSRQNAIRRFQEQQGFGALVMSPLAAGVGLNITEANHVIHYSRHWNPAKEAQATDRVYRIGQKRPVHIYRPMATDSEFKTFDVVLNELLQRKAHLATVTLYPSEQSEVTPMELFEHVAGGKGSDAPQGRFDMLQVDKLNPYKFEALCAAVLEKQDYQVQLTPLSNDRGADVVCLAKRGNLLLQAKHASGSVGDEAVGEILKARPFFESSYNERFQLVVMTNGRFTQAARAAAAVNSVELRDRGWLKEALERSPVTLRDVVRLDAMREARV